MNFENLGDKIIDDQGNVKTIAGGQDARLYYLDVEGNRKKYLLEGEAAGGSDTSDILIVEGEKLKVGGVNEDNTPKFTDVDIYGEFVTTHGEGLIVYGPEQELLSVLDDELKYKNEYDIQRMKRKSIGYFDFESNTFLSSFETLTSIDFNLPQGTLENAILQFSTGDTIEFTITGSSSYKINKPFAFEPNKTYLIYVDVYNIFWCELQNFNQ